MSEFPKRRHEPRPDSRPKPRIVISKCIGSEACRYNGEIVEDKFVHRLAAHVEFICICPGGGDWTRNTARSGAHCFGRR